MKTISIYHILSFTSPLSFYTDAHWKKEKKHVLFYIKIFEPIQYLWKIGATAYNVFSVVQFIFTYLEESVNFEFKTCIPFFAYLYDWLTLFHLKSLKCPLNPFLVLSYLFFRKILQASTDKSTPLFYLTYKSNL